MKKKLFMLLAVCLFVAGNVFVTKATTYDTIWGQYSAKDYVRVYYNTTRWSTQDTVGVYVGTLHVKEMRLGLVQEKDYRGVYAYYNRGTKTYTSAKTVKSWSVDWGCQFRLYVESPSTWWWNNWDGSITF